MTHRPRRPRNLRRRSRPHAPGKPRGRGRRVQALQGAEPQKRAAGPPPTPFATPATPTYPGPEPRPAGGAGRGCATSLDTSGAAGAGSGGAPATASRKGRAQSRQLRVGYGCDVGGAGGDKTAGRARETMRGGRADGPATGPGAGARRPTGGAQRARALCPQKLPARRSWGRRSFPGRRVPSGPTPPPARLGVGEGSRRVCTPWAPPQGAGHHVHL